jgi:hypothetical protein
MMIDKTLVVGEDPRSMRSFDVSTTQLINCLQNHAFGTLDAFSAD